jgi:predicted O-linked N-acetylglucosamine transferase (SPINDLY family)
LASVGHKDWWARDREDYVETVVRLAKDVSGRQELRFSLREAMRRSPLSDARGLASSMEEAYEAMLSRLASGHA